MADWRLFTERDWYESELHALDSAQLPFWDPIVDRPSDRSRVLASKTEFRANLRRLRSLVTEDRTRSPFEHGTEKKLPRSHNRRVYRLTDHGTLLAAICVHHSQAFNMSVVHALISIDVPWMPPFAAVRAALLFIITDAIKSGGSLAVQFAQAFRNRVPDAVKTVADTCGVLLSRVEHGQIAPDEARSLYLALTPLSTTARDTLRGLHARGQLSIDRVCYLIHRDIWPAEEVDVVLRLSPHPELVLGRPHEPESGHLYWHATAHSRMAVLAGAMVRALALRSEVSEGILGNVSQDDAIWIPLFGADPLTRTLLIRPASEPLALAGWDPRGRTGPPFTLQPGQELRIAPRARSRAELVALLEVDLLTLGRRGAVAVPFDYALLPDLERERLQAVADKCDVRLFVCPLKVAELDGEIRQRIRLARHVRR